MRVKRKWIAPYLARVLKSATAKQSGLLMSTQGLAMSASFALTMLITRGLTVAEYGTFRYAMIYLALGSVVLQFGFSYSAARVLALENNTNAQKQIVGATVVVVILSTIVGVCATAAVIAAAQLLGSPLPDLLLWVAPFLYVTVGQYMVTSICQGLNRIHVLSAQQVIPYVFLLPVTAFQIYWLRSYSLVAALVTYVSVFSLVITLGFWRLGVSFAQLRSWLRVIAIENRRTGLPIYVGGLFGVASAHLIAMWAAQFANPARYAQYTLALAVAAPLGVLVSSIGTVIFRSSSNSRQLSRQVVLYAFALGIVLGAIYWMAAEVLLVPAFGIEYTASVRMAELLGAGALMIGWGDIFQRFMGAQGQGRRAGAVAVLTGIVGITTAAILLPKWNVLGAIASSVSAAATYFFFMMVLYLRYTRRPV